VLIESDPTPKTPKKLPQNNIVINLVIFSFDFLFAMSKTPSPAPASASTSIPHLPRNGGLSSNSIDPTLPLPASPQVLPDAVQLRRKQQQEQLANDVNQALQAGWKAVHDSPTTAYFFHPDHAGEVFLSWQEAVAASQLRAKAQTEARRQARLRGLARNHGQLIVDIEEYIHARKDQTMDDVLREAAVLPNNGLDLFDNKAAKVAKTAKAAKAEEPAAEEFVLGADGFDFDGGFEFDFGEPVEPVEPEAAASCAAASCPEADDLEARAETLRILAAELRNKAKEAARSGDFDMAKSIKEQARKKDTEASQLDDQADDIRQQQVVEQIKPEQTLKATLLRASELETQRKAEIQRLQHARNTGIENEDYDQAKKLKASEVAFEEVGQRLAQLSVTKWTASIIELREQKAQQQAELHALRERTQTQDCQLKKFRTTFHALAWCTTPRELQHHDFQEMQQIIKSLKAADGVDELIAVLKRHGLNPYSRPYYTIPGRTGALVGNTIPYYNCVFACLDRKHSEELLQKWDFAAE
jgi:hypothetical protein